MDQDSFNDYISSVLTELGIENVIIWQPDDPSLSNYDVVVKVGDDDLVFHTFASYCSSSNVKYFYCYFDKSNIEFFDMDLSKYYGAENFKKNNFSYSPITPDVENEIKKCAKEHIIQTLKQLKLID